MGYNNLIIDSLLFFLFGCLAWSVNIAAKSIFPGNNLFPISMRTAILLGVVIASYFLNLKLLRKNALNESILNFDFKLRSIQQSLAGIVLGCALIFIILTVLYFVFPFQIVQNVKSTIAPFNDWIFYSLDNALEEMLFRVFLLLALMKLIGKINGALVISLLFGIFHLQGLGFTTEGMSMVATTFTMSLLLVSIIYYTKSVWPAITFHITINLLLHSVLGFDRDNNGIFQLEFITSAVNPNFVTLLYETVVSVFVILIYFRSHDPRKTDQLV